MLRGSKAWLEIDVTEQIPAADMNQLVEESLADSDMEICRIKNKILADRALKQIDGEETLDDLSELDVFTRLLDEHEINDPEKREELILTYRETLLSIEEKDLNAN
jgi:exonuclease SbcD